ncbi:hypothetical protein ACLOJK_003798 [Asimina triloba]
MAAADEAVTRRRKPPSNPAVEAAVRSPPPSHPTSTAPRRRQPSLPPPETHRHQALHRAIQATHHDDDDAHIPDLLRSQADVDHRGHMRRVFLARHQQLQLHSAPIVAHFRSKQSHRLIWIFMAHSTDFDPRMDQRQRSTRRFLLKPISSSIFFKSIYLQCRPPRCRRRARPDATIRLHPLLPSAGVTTAHATHAVAARCHRHRPFHCRPLPTPSTVTIARS